MITEEDVCIYLTKDEKNRAVGQDEKEEDLRIIRRK